MLYLFFSDICFSFLLYSIFKVQHYVQLNVEHGGGKESRTPDPLLARQVLSQLSYTPKGIGSHLSSRTVSSEVLSAVWVLTIVFGMGTGVTPRRIATKCIVIRFRLITKQ